MPDRAEQDHERKQGLERLKGELRKELLARASTTLGLLADISSLRNGATGRYRDPWLDQTCDATEADELLREIHQEIFFKWLNLSLEQQRGELEEYLISIKNEKGSDFGAWLTLAPYRDFIPAQAEAAERELYESDLAILLDVLKSKVR